METKPTDFRDRLLNAERTTPALREEYRTELDALLNHRLTPRGRLLAWVVIIASLVTAGLCVRSAIVHHDKPDGKIVSLTFALCFVGLAVWLARALWQGAISRRESFAMVEWLGGIFAAVFIGATLFRGMHSPADPDTVFNGIMAIMLAMVGFAWGTGNRIAAAKLETREHLLRVESRLADLAEQLKR